MSRFLAAMAALAISSLGCAPARPALLRELIPGVDDERPATRAEVEPREAAGFLDRAAEILQAEGHRIAGRTGTQVVTAPRDGEVRCGAYSCRVREVAAVYVSGTIARVEIVRAVRSRSDGRWRIARDDDAEREIAVREAVLMRAMLGPEKVELSFR